MVVGPDSAVIAAYLQAEEKEVFGTEDINIAPDTESLRKGHISFPLGIAYAKDFSAEANSINGWSYRLFKLNVFYPALPEDDKTRFTEYLDDACTFGRTLTVIRPEGSNNTLLRYVAPTQRTSSFESTQSVESIHSHENTSKSRVEMRGDRAIGPSAAPFVEDRTNGASSLVRIPDYNDRPGRASIVINDNPTRLSSSFQHAIVEVSPVRLQSTVQVSALEGNPQRLGSTIQHAVSADSLHRLGSSFQYSSINDQPSRLGSSVQHALSDDVPHRPGSSTQHSIYEDTPSRLQSSLGQDFIRDTRSPDPHGIQRSRTPNPDLSPEPKSELKERYPWHHRLRTLDNDLITAEQAIEQAAHAVSARQPRDYNTRFKEQYDKDYAVETSIRAWQLWQSRSPNPSSKSPNQSDYDPRPLTVDVLIMNLADTLTYHPARPLYALYQNESPKHSFLQRQFEILWEHLVDLPYLLRKGGTAYILLPAMKMTYAVISVLKRWIYSWADHEGRCVWDIATVGVTSSGEEVVCIWRTDGVELNDEEGVEDKES